MLPKLFEFAFIIINLLNFKTASQLKYESYDCDRLSQSIKLTDFGYVELVVLTIENFDSFAQLKFICDDLIGVHVLQFIPNKKIILDNTLDLSSLKFQTPSLTIHFSLIKGIDLNTNLSFTSEAIPYFDFSYSDFKFYVNNADFDEQQCLAYKSSDTNLLTNIINLSLRNFILFKSKLCPSLFNNSKLNQLVVSNIANTYLNKNTFEFVDIAQNLIAANFESLLLTLFYEKLTTKIINPLVFKDMHSLVAQNTIVDIELDLFKHFKRLERVTLQLFNFKQLFHAGNEWLSYLRYSSTSYDLNDDSIDFKQYTPMVVLFKHNTQTTFNIVYEYPDEDFCLFHRFPHEKIVYPVLDPGSHINCSCTVLWLIQHTFTFFAVEKTDKYLANFYLDPIFNDIFRVSLENCLVDPAYHKNFKLCSFKERAENCNKTRFKAADSSPLFEISSDNDFLYLVKWLEFIFVVILSPIAAFLGLLSNLLILIVAHNFKSLKKRDPNFTFNKSSQSLFLHIKLSSVFNLILCSITIFKLVNECLFYTSSVYCSRVAISKSAQWFKIIVIEFAGNVVKTCCNISYLGISFNRLMIISKKKHLCAAWIKKYNMLIYVLCLLAFSTIISLFKLFQYETNAGYFGFGTLDFPSEKRTNDYCFLTANLNDCEVFKIARIANYAVNNVLFLFINVVFDLILFYLYGRHMVKKKKICNNYNEEESINMKEKITKMIVINGVVYVVSHFPELIVLVVLYAFEDEMFYFCLNQMTCDKLNEIVQFFIFISIIAQLFICNRFNKQFSISLGDLIKSFRRKIKPASKSTNGNSNMLKCKNSTNWLAYS